MKFGDHCWLKGLETHPHLNGKHVTLYEWVQDKERWKCTPHGWSHTDEFIGVKPKNLSNEPPPKRDLEAEAVARTAADDRIRARLAQNVAAMAVAEEMEESDDDNWEETYETECTNAVWRLKYPTFDVALEAVRKHYTKCDDDKYMREMHKTLKHMFESKHDKEVVQSAGKSLGDHGGLELMQAAFYNYQKVLYAMALTKHMNDTTFRTAWGSLRQDLYTGWDGISGWRN